MTNFINKKGKITKKLILVIAVLCISAWLWNGTDDAPVPDNLLMMNVEALASGPDGGGGGPGNPEDGKQYFDCWELFYLIESPQYYRHCTEQVQARSGARECMEFYAKYQPVDSSKKTCYKSGKKPDPAQ